MIKRIQGDLQGHNTFNTKVVSSKQVVTYPNYRNSLQYDQVSFTGKTPKNAKSIIKQGCSVATIFKQGVKKLTQQTSTLSSQEANEIAKILQEKEAQLKKLEEERLQLARILDYNKLKEEGFSAKKIKRFVRQDNAAIKRAEKFTAKNLELRERMFGYPANMTEDSAMTKHLRNKEAELPLLNNCGDTYQTGNYAMDSKEYEKALLNKLFKHFGLKEYGKSNAWGYITTGGSESNRWGINNGLKKFPNARVYYSDAAHYSVDKSVKIGPDVNGSDIVILKNSKIQNKPNSEKIDSDVLLNEVRKNWNEKKEPAVILLTWGTTKSGAIDDVAKISKTLNVEKIPHYIHLDAAMYGGIAKNQKQAPSVPNIEKLGVDSVSVSLHKYFGNQDVKSAIITKESPMAPVVDYIGQVDSTTAGSRNLNPFSSLQRVTEALERKMPDNYIKNINCFDNLLKEHKVNFTRESKSNTFVIDKPSEKICKKYQLSDFKDDNGIDKAHIIIFPYHKEKVMKEFVKELANDLLK